MWRPTFTHPPSDLDPPARAGRLAVPAATRKGRAKFTRPALRRGATWLALRKQALDLADARQRVLGAVPVISLDGSVERLLQADLPLMQREGVAPANFHLGPRGIRLCETIASMRNGALDKVDDLAEARSRSIGCVSAVLSRAFSTAWLGQNGIAQAGRRGRRARSGPRSPRSAPRCSQG